MVNIIVFSNVSLFIICKCKKAIATNFDQLTTSQNEDRDNIGDPEPNEHTPLLQSNSSPQNTECNGDPNNDSNGCSNSPTVPNIPAIETNQSLMVPVDIHQESTSDTDNEHSNNNESTNPSSTTVTPVEAPHSTTVDSKINCVDAEQKDINENVALIVAVQTNESEDPAC